VLYSLLPLAATLLVAVAWWIPAGAGRILAEGTISLAILGCMALWVRANRLALALLDEPDESEAPFRAWVAYQPPVPRRRELVAQASESRPRSAA
jgi:hypothetical protein